MATDPAFLSARRQAALVRKRAIGCRELLDHMIARVERLDGALNAVVVRDFERARDRAKKLDRTKEPTGKLHGVPMTFKESYDVAGLPTTWGVESRRGSIAAQNALAVRRMLDAGVVVFGKTNVPVMLGDWQSFNPVYGSTSNPWNLERTPGGSSGGSAAALAAGLTGLESGSDIGGSIRQPAHACGVYGHKPTWGLIPPYGHSFAPGNASMADISVIGPLARSADDLALALDILAGPDEAETHAQIALPGPRTKSLKDLRVAVWASDPAAKTSAETTTALLDLGKHLRREGARVSLTARPQIDARAAFENYLELLSATLGVRASREQLDRIAERAERLGPDDRSATAILARAAQLSFAEWSARNEQRHKLRRSWGAFFQDWDVLLCPVLGIPAPAKMEDTPTWDLVADIDGEQVPWNELLFWPGITGGVHLPATAAPLALSKDGMPIGVQIVGPLYGDRVTIAVAQMLEASWRAYEPPPGWA